MKLNGFWKDIGMPNDFILCTKIFLKYLIEINRVKVDDFDLKVDHQNIKGPCLIHKYASIH